MSARDIEEIIAEMDAMIEEILEMENQVGYEINAEKAVA